MVPHSSPSVPGSGRKRPTCQQCGKPRKGHPRGRCLGPEPFADVPAVLPAQIETEVDDDHLLHCRRCHANFDPSSPTQCIIPHVFVSDRFYEGKDRKRVFLSQCCTWKIYVAQTRDNKWDMDMMETRCHFVGQHSATGLHENEINGVNVFDCWNNGRGVCRRVPIEDEVDSPVWTDKFVILTQFPYAFPGYSTLNFAVSTRSGRGNLSEIFTASTN
ncbi:hypothetical protein DL96DRAFT_472973 [Flagelloscypha sp. PMI_526]|nr:hypothetical protein DL96DRAFT_472973 [Flagelloscypha sp. PMI_526]